eukprot:jgi/Tetstr1/459615/TSEL_004978.t1
MGTGVKNASVDAEDKAVLSAAFDECLPRDTRTGIPYPLKKTPRFSIAAPLLTERICYATFNFRAGYTIAENDCYAIIKETGNVRGDLARHCFRDAVGKDAPVVGRKKGPLPSEHRLAKANDLAEAWQQSELGKHYEAGKCPPSNVVFKGEEEVWAVTPHSEAVELNAMFGVMKQHPTKAGGIIKHNSKAVKNMAVTQAFPGDNVDEGSSPEPPAKKAKQPAKPGAGVPARGRGDGGAKAGGGPFGPQAGRQAARRAWGQYPLPPPASSRPAAVTVPAETGCM